MLNESAGAVVKNAKGMEDECVCGAVVDIDVDDAIDTGCSSSSTTLPDPPVIDPNPGEDGGVTACVLFAFPFPPPFSVSPNTVVLPPGGAKFERTVLLFAVRMGTRDDTVTDDCP